MDLFKKCITKDGLDRDDIASSRVQSAICSFIKVIDNIQIDPTTNGMNDYNEIFKDVVTTLLFAIPDSFGIFNEVETICVASVELLTTLLRKQKHRCPPHHLTKVREFWNCLIECNEFTLLSVMSAKTMAMENGSKAVKTFFQLIDTL